MDRASRQERSAEGAEVEVAAVRAEAFGEVIERLGVGHLEQVAEAACGADVAGREDVEASQAAQEDERGAPWADAGL